MRGHPEVGKDWWLDKSRRKFKLLKPWKALQSSLSLIAYSIVIISRWKSVTVCEGWNFCCRLSGNNDRCAIIRNTKVSSSTSTRPYIVRVLKVSHHHQHKSTPLNSSNLLYAELNSQMMMYILKTTPIPQRGINRAPTLPIHPRIETVPAHERFSNFMCQSSEGWKLHNKLWCIISICCTWNELKCKENLNLLEAWCFSFN